MRRCDLSLRVTHATRGTTEPISYCHNQARSGAPGLARGAETRVDGQRSSARSTAGMRMMRGSGDLSDFKPLGRVLAHELLRRLSSWCAAGLPPGSSESSRPISRSISPSRSCSRRLPNWRACAPTISAGRSSSRSGCRRTATTRAGASSTPRRCWRPALSVTDIGIAVGFSETSSFTAAFRRATELTPSAYHRSLV
jgi:AraC-like DNA-binding protein